MTKYQLAKLISMVGEMQSRKRIQKTVFLLKAAGCPIDADYRLHYYGPYSAQVAGLVDEMVDDGILEETSHSMPWGVQYHYSFNKRFQDSFEEHEQAPSGKAAVANLARYDGLFHKLCKTPPRELELASTIVFFRQRGQDWAEAIEQTRRFKNEDANSQRMKDAELLAREIAP